MPKIKDHIEELAWKISARMIPELKEYIREIIESQGKDDQLLTVEEAMDLMKIKSRATIHFKFRDGYLTKIKTGNRVLVSKNEVLRHIETQCKK